MSYSKSSANTKSLANQIDEEIVEDDQKPQGVKSDAKVPGIVYNKFRPQDYGTQITVKTFRDNLMLARKVDGSGVSVPLVRAAPAIMNPFDKSTFSYTYPDSRSKPDETMFKALIVAKLPEYANPTLTQFRSNGTRDGLLKRMIKQLSVKNQHKNSSSLYMVNRASQMLPCRADYAWLNQISASDPCFNSVNMKADAGFPYAFLNGLETVKTGGTTLLQLEYRAEDKTQIVPLSDKPMNVTKHALYWAKKIWKIMDEGQDVVDAITKLGGFFDEYPELRTFFLKRKDDKYDRSEFMEKVRPYGCMPLPTRFFCSWAVSPWEEQVESFIENKNSISAYHFSPFYGGAVRMLEYFEFHHKEKKRRFFGISYGDDQLWCIRCDDESMIFLNPDVVAMDMSTQSDTVTFLTQYIKRVFKNIPSTNLNAFVSAISLAFHHSMHVGGPYVVSKGQSMLSGVNGTTLINIGNSARIQTIVEDVVQSYTGPINSTTIFKVIARSFKAVKEVLKYTFKGCEALEFDAANKTSDELWKIYNHLLFSTNVENLRVTGLPLAFLAMKVVVLDGNPVCVPADMFKLGASLVLPANVPDKRKIQHELERLVGVAFSGGWYDEKFHSFLQSTYISLRKLESHEIDIDFSELNPIFERDSMEIIQSLGLKEIPDRQFFIDLNVMNKVDFQAKYKGRKTAVGVKDPSTSSSTSTSSKDEVTASEDFIDLVQELQGLNLSILDPPKIDPAKAGNANALTLEQEKEKIKKREIRWAKERARRFVNKTFKEDSEYKGLREFVEEDFSLEVFDDMMFGVQEDLDGEEREAFNQYKNEEYNNDNWISYQEEYNLGDDDFVGDIEVENPEDEYDFGKANYLNDDM